MEEVKRGKSTANLMISHLHPHPKNPRKNLGDLAELTESIKKNGIMQNLTVIPGYYDEDAFINSEEEYTVIIGHRRLEAARAAGLCDVPCRIYKNLPENDQIATMLEENMQRNDLTVYEQAQSFQLMLDLGETVDTLSEKTGFKKTTIYHRLNIAKLDQNVLKEKEEKEGFQLTISDLIELEKVKDIKTRNKILEEATGPNDLRFKADQAAKAEKREILEADAEKILKERGLKEGTTSNRWDGKYDTLYRHNMTENDNTNVFVIPEEIDEQIEEGAVYLISYGEVTILNPKPSSNDEDNDEEEAPEAESEWEKRKRERQEREEQYHAIRDPLDRKTHDFVMDIIIDKLDDIEEKEILGYCESMLKVIMKYDSDTSFLSWEDLIKFITGSDKWDFDTEEEFEEEVSKRENMPLHHKLLVVMAATMKNMNLLRYDGEYPIEIGRTLLMGYDILERWGWTYTDDERLILNGNHDLYVWKEDEKED